MLGEVRSGWNIFGQVEAVRAGWDRLGTAPRNQKVRIDKTRLRHLEHNHKQFWVLAFLYRLLEITKALKALITFFEFVPLCFSLFAFL